MQTVKKQLFTIVFACLALISKGQIAPTADSIRPIWVGQKIPTQTLQNTDGQTVTTDALFAQKKTILIFYRGGWCPYCNVHLKEIGEMEQKLVDLGYQIVAVSPDAPEKLKTTEAKDSLRYTLLSDSKTALMQKMGIAFYGPDKYKKLFNEASNGDNTEGVLPVPSVFFVDKMGKIAFSYLDPNYKKRLSGKLVLAIATNLDLPEPEVMGQKQEISTKNAANTPTATAANPTANTNAMPQKMPQQAVSSDNIHGGLDSLLSTYVTADGRVNYKGLKKEKSKLDAYVKTLQSNVPATSADKNTRLAFWINAYNALTLKLIVENYPLSKITNLDGGKTWDVKRTSFEGKKLSLNDIENNIIRPMGDPRIHFAVNCAAKSCPPLLNKAYTAANVESLLENRTRQFINSSANKLTANELSVSKIFEWYGKDFGNVAGFIAKYAKTKVSKTAKLAYNEYDWSLNE